MTVITKTRCISQVNEKLTSKSIIEGNPFYNKVTLASSQWLQTLALGTFLVPIKLVLILLAIIVFWLPYCMVMAVTSLGEEITPAERDFVMWFMWVLYKIVGINVTMEGRLFTNVSFLKQLHMEGHS